MAYIAKAIGPTFGSEVLASSVAGLPFSWGDDGVEWADGALAEEQVVTLTSLVEAHDPTRRPPRLATGKQIAEALADLGQLAVWDTALSAGKKPEDRYYWESSYRDQIPENNAKLNRIAVAAGLSLSTIYDRAVLDPRS